jgi:hypothetical protein
MAGRHSKRNRRSANAKARRRAGVIGVGSAAGAALAFGLTPFPNAPVANADVLDSIIDPLISSLSSFDPGLATDATGWLSGLDSALAATSSADPSSAAVTTTDYAQLYETYVYDPIHTDEQDWINSSYGESFDTELNTD